MIKTFTQNDLIRFLYHETTEEESREINNALLCDADLRLKMQELQHAQLALDDAALEPSPASVLSILSYSRSVPPGGH